MQLDAAIRSLPSLLPAQVGRRKGNSLLVRLHYPQVRRPFPSIISGRKCARPEAVAAMQARVLQPARRRGILASQCVRAGIRQLGSGTRPLTQPGRRSENTCVRVYVLSFCSRQAWGGRSSGMGTAFQALYLDLLCSDTVRYDTILPSSQSNHLPGTHRT